MHGIDVNVDNRRIAEVQCVGPIWAALGPKMEPRAIREGIAVGTRWKKLGTVGIVACLGIMVLLLFVVAGCGGGTETTTTAAGTPTTGAVTTAPTGGETSSTVGPTKSDTLLIGASMPLSGPASVAGLAVANGWKAGVEKVNADGGITIGDTNYKLEIAIEDSKGTADGATTAATKLAL